METQVVPQFGWIPFDRRSREQNRAHEEALLTMPPFVIVGRTNYKEGKTLLTQLWKHPRVVQALGYEFPGIKQFTGSCVGAGGGNALFTLIAADCLVRNDPEEICVPFWLLPYGRSRFYMGDRSPGEGSQGSTFAKAVREDGTLPANRDGLPSFQVGNSGALEWGGSVEYSWSDGDAPQTMELLPESRKHLVRTTSQCRNADCVRDAIVNGYPVTIASNWGGQMQCSTQGEPPVLLNRRTGSWAHQMSVHNWWDHPTLGEIFYVMNQWGHRAHGTCPTGVTPGGFWVKKEEIEWICRNGEVYAFSQFDGFPAQDVPWDWENDWFV